MATIPPEVVGDGERYFSGKAKNGTLIYVGPVTTAQLRDAGIKGLSTGYFLCEFNAEDPIGSLEILASFVSPEAAYRLAEILSLYQTDRAISSFEEVLI